MQDETQSRAELVALARRHEDDVAADRQGKVDLAKLRESEKARRRAFELAEAAAERKSHALGAAACASGAAIAKLEDELPVDYRIATNATGVALRELEAKLTDARTTQAIVHQHVAALKKEPDAAKQTVKAAERTALEADLAVTKLEVEHGRALARAEAAQKASRAALERLMRDWSDAAIAGR